MPRKQRLVFGDMELETTGGRDGDEVFSVTNIGHFNVSRIHRAFRSRPEIFHRDVADITPEVIKYIREKNDPDPHRLLWMTDEEAAQRYAVSLEMIAPTEDRPREVQIIDGNHLLLWLWERGVRQAPMLVVPISRREQFRVTYRVRRAGENWREVTPEETLAQTQGMYVQPDGRVLDAEGRFLGNATGRRMTTSGAYAFSLDAAQLLAEGRRRR